MIETAAPGLHDAILLCAGIAAVYLVVAMLQLLQIRRHSETSQLRVAVCEPSVGPMLSDKEEQSRTGNASFSEQLKLRHSEAELQRLKSEVERLHSEVRAMHEEIRQLRSERITPVAVPLYNEALGFARRGLSSDQIAARCGISRSEAELVAALAGNAGGYGIADEKRRSAIAMNEHNERQHNRYRAAA